MLHRRSVLMAAAASIASGCVPRASLSAALERSDTSLRLVSAANPHVFPLMLALALEPPALRAAQVQRVRSWE